MEPGMLGTRTDFEKTTALTDGWCNASPTNCKPQLASSSAYSRFGKRVFDLAFSLASLLLLGFWLIPLIEILINLDSKRLMFFRQNRVRKYNKIIQCFEFCTMMHDPAAVFVQAQKNNSRASRVGRVLRKPNLDDSPQFMNGFYGEMSVWGCAPMYLSWIWNSERGLGGGYPTITIVAPGATAAAQILDCRRETKCIRSRAHRARFDLLHSKNANF